jgi:hypothetical protein
MLPSDRWTLQIVTRHHKFNLIADVMMEQAAEMEFDLIIMPVIHGNFSCFIFFVVVLSGVHTSMSMLLAVYVQGGIPGAIYEVYQYRTCCFAEETGRSWEKLRRNMRFPLVSPRAPRFAYSSMFVSCAYIFLKIELIWRWSISVVLG